MESAESGRVTITVSDGEETYIWTYPEDEASCVRDVIVKQVEEGRLHPYIGLMAIHTVTGVAG